MRCSKCGIKILDRAAYKNKRVLCPLCYCRAIYKPQRAENCIKAYLALK
jgi:DNA-directed RNA polymerase subunit RPC12/RpoP